MQNKTLAEFTKHIIMAEQPLVGGGSTAALAGSIAASLYGLIASISEEGLDANQLAELKQMGEHCSNLREELLAAVSDDCNSFEDVMAAFKMPKATDEEKALRSAKIQEGYKKAIAVPMATAQKSASLFKPIHFLMQYGNKNAETDILVAAMCVRTAVLGAVYNVKINLKSVKDAAYSEQTMQQAIALEKQALVCEKQILDLSTLVEHNA